MPLVYEFIPVFSKRWQSMIVCFFCFLSHCIIDRALTNNGQFCSFLSFSLATPYTFGFPRPPQLCSSFFFFFFWNCPLPFVGLTSRKTDGGRLSVNTQIITNKKNKGGGGGFEPCQNNNIPPPLQHTLSLSIITPDQI